MASGFRKVVRARWRAIARRGVRAGAPRLAGAVFTLLAVISAAPTAALPGGPTLRAAEAAAGATLVEYGAGTLAVPFKAINSEFQAAHPGVEIQAQFGGSVKMAKQITELHEPADVLAVADYSVIPQQLYARPGARAHATWYAGFASNAITFVYTDRSKGAGKIDAGNWYEVLARPGVQIGRSNPDTDPSGYQTLQMLELAEKHYRRPGLAGAILKNAPTKNIRDTETELIGALESGQIDYLAIYRSDALQHHFKYLQLPREIDLSDPSLAAEYATVSVRTRNGDLSGRPIIYAITIPTDAPHPAEALAWTQFLLGPQGSAAMRANGFSVIEPIANGVAAMPPELRRLVRTWPGS